MPILPHAAVAAECKDMQSGQALVESLVAMLALAVLWVALHWLAHYQDMALSAIHASRHLAFVAARAVPEEAGHAVAQRFFNGLAHRWTDRRGRVLLEDTAVHVSQSRPRPLSAQAQPGKNLPHSAILRRDWGLEDAGILRARVALDFSRMMAPSRKHGKGLLGLHVFDLPYPPVARSTSILTGAGHAASDAGVQDRVAASRLAWSDAQVASRTAGEEIALRAHGVDAGWDRADARFDWLRPWSGRVPGHILENYEGD